MHLIRNPIKVWARLHLLEAFIPYYRLTKDPLARERLFELVLIQSNTVLRKGLGHPQIDTYLTGLPILNVIMIG